MSDIDENDYGVEEGATIGVSNKTPPPKQAAQKKADPVSAEKGSKPQGNDDDEDEDEMIIKKVDFNPSKQSGVYERKEKGKQISSK
jgi:hypothetical protein